jgi:lysophospholipid acyltransferase (LPLAT)-like uncharacterized protein
MPYSLQLLSAIAQLSSYLVMYSLRKKIYVHSSVSLMQPSIMCFWHGKSFLPIMQIRHLGHQRYTGFVSHSKDGELLAQLLKKIGYQVVRGSSSKKGLSGLIQLIKMLRNGYTVGITPDGPRGPRHKVDSGCAYLAAKTQLPILPIGSAYTREKKFHSWDQFEYPLPFTQAVLYLGEPLWVSAAELNAEAQVIHQHIAQAIHAADAKAQQLLNHPIEHDSSIQLL